MKTSQLPTLRFLSLLFLLPGLGGLILSAAISTYYLDHLPRWPEPDEGRVVSRAIHGAQVFQTAEEDRRLSLIEYSSVGCFVLGLTLGVVYLEKWGAVQGKEEQEETAEDRG